MEEITHEYLQLNTLLKKCEISFSCPLKMDSL